MGVRRGLMPWWVGWWDSFVAPILRQAVRVYRPDPLSSYFSSTTSLEIPALMSGACKASLSICSCSFGEVTFSVSETFHLQQISFSEQICFSPAVLCFSISETSKSDDDEALLDEIR
ncbi:hypothetical protein GPALN_004058 [Globodera pallida]|nr:hypothetical protein GPALN_004058 [Globodera pallida]